MIAIGDIHGCHKELRVLVDALLANEELIFLGDYVDRGLDSKATIDYLLQLERTRSCRFLRGNHDAMMLSVYDGSSGDAQMWLDNGGLKTVQDYTGVAALNLPRLRSCVPQNHIDFLRRTELYYETEDYFFVHGGIAPHLTVAQAKLAHLDHAFYWMREHIYAKNFVWEKPVVCGHTIQDEPLVKELLICIDTGVHLPYIGRGAGHLTAIELPERKITQVASKSLIITEYEPVA